MDKVTLYWTIVVGVVSAGWAITAFIRDRASQSIERTSAMVTRLIEGDKLLLENPDIQKFISQNARQGEGYFRNEAVLGEEIFYKAKTYAYRQLNSFDEILSIASRTGRRSWFLRPPVLVEISDWESYIKIKLRPPLYRSILNNEIEISGGSLRDYWKKNKKDIESLPVDPFMW